MRHAPIVMLLVTLVGFAPLAVAQDAPRKPAAGEGPCGTPRQAALTFLENLQPDRNLPEKAIRCFQGGPKVQRDVLMRRAKNLKAVLDARGHFIDLDLLAQFDPDNGNLQAPSVYARHVMAVRKGENAWLLALERHLDAAGGADLRRRLAEAAA